MTGESSEPESSQRNTVRLTPLRAQSFVILGKLESEKYFLIVMQVMVELEVERVESRES